MEAMDEYTSDLPRARAALVEQLREHALVVGEVTLTSGAVAQYYVDAKRAILRPCGLRRAGRAACRADAGVGRHGGRRDDDGRGRGRVRGARRRARR